MLSRGSSVDNNSALKLVFCPVEFLTEAEERGKCSHERPYVQIILLNKSKRKLYNKTNIAGFMILILNLSFCFNY